MTHNEYKGLGTKWYNYSTVINHRTKTDTEKEGAKMSDTTRIAHTLRRTDFIVYLNRNTFGPVEKKIVPVTKCPPF
jgi:hypothetical protein